MHTARHCSHGMGRGYRLRCGACYWLQTVLFFLKSDTQITDNTGNNGHKTIENMKAFAYLRTSNVAKTGDKTDSASRQRDAIKRLDGFEVVAEYYDDGVSGAVSIADRPEFAKLLDAIEANGVKTVLVEDASRFARDLITQETGLVALIERGVKVFAANGDELTATDDPMRVAMRQIAGTFAQLEKTRLVHKLKAGRDRKWAAGEKGSGRFSMAEKYPDAVPLAKRLYRRSPKTGERRSLRKIAKLLADEGYVIRGSGKPFSASMVKTMCYGPLPEKGALASYVNSA